MLKTDKLIRCDNILNRITKAVFLDERVLYASFRVRADPANCSGELDIVVDFINPNCCFKPEIESEGD
jgi:hypothetical protein